MTNPRVTPISIHVLKWLIQIHTRLYHSGLKLGIRCDAYDIEGKPPAAGADETVSWCGVWGFNITASDAGPNFQFIASTGGRVYNDFYLAFFFSSLSLHFSSFLRSIPQTPLPQCHVAWSTARCLAPRTDWRTCGVVVSKLRLQVPRRHKGRSLQYLLPPATKLLTLPGLAPRAVVSRAVYCRTGETYTNNRRTTGLVASCAWLLSGIPVDCRALLNLVLFVFTVVPRQWPSCGALTFKAIH